MALAVIVIARKLRPCFQRQMIIIKTKYPIKQVLKKLDLDERMVARAVELSEYDISFVSRSDIKSRALTDFVVRFSMLEEIETLEFIGGWIFEFKRKWNRKCIRETYRFMCLHVFDGPIDLRW